MMSFGERNEIALSSSRPITETRSAVLDISGGGLDMGDVRFRRDGDRYVAFNSVSRPMFRRIIEDFRQGGDAGFEINGRRYRVPMADVAEVYRGMLACQRSLMNMVIGDIE